MKLSQPKICTRLARPEEIPAISSLLRQYARHGLVLPRTAKEIADHLRTFIVCLEKNTSNKCGQTRFMGCVAIRDYGSGLMEIRSLSVRDEAKGKGIGTRLVKSAISLAKKRNAKRIFALTLRPNLFYRIGFIEVDKSVFPQKVWSDCRYCPKRDSCDETALLWVA